MKHLLVKVPNSQWTKISYKKVAGSSDFWFLDIIQSITDHNWSTTNKNLPFFRTYFAHSCSSVLLFSLYKLGPRQEALRLGPQKAYYAILKPYLPESMLTQLMKYASEAANANRSEYQINADVRLNMLHVIPRLSKYVTLQKLEVCAQLNAPEKRFKICHIFGIRKPT